MSISDENGEIGAILANLTDQTETTFDSFLSSLFLPLQPTNQTPNVSRKRSKECNTAPKTKNTVAFRSTHKKVKKDKDEPSISSNMKFARTEFGKLGRSLTTDDCEFLSNKTESWMLETISGLRQSPAREYFQMLVSPELIRYQKGGGWYVHPNSTWVIWGFISRENAQLAVKYRHQAVLRFSESLPGEIALTRGSEHYIVKWMEGKVGIARTIVGGNKTLTRKYDTIWDMFSNLGITELYGGECGFVNIRGEQQNDAIMTDTDNTNSHA